MGVRPPDPDQGFPSPYLADAIKNKARRLARTSRLGNADPDDWRQELTFRLLAKRHLYDPGRGASFNTFGSRVLDSEVKMILRDAGRQKRAAGNRAVSLDAPDPDGVTPASAVGADAHARRRGVEPQDVVTAATGRERSAVVTETVAALPAPLGALAEGLKQGESITVIAKSMGCSRQGVYRGMAELRKRFESAGLNNF